ncbi:MAG TPA: sulfite exporter TauE/SafE family protein [Mycobacteriales bacterium]|nr:sulfite exporter TauE/SafE family protein [Mycobacteriales bacterium]
MAHPEFTSSVISLILIGAIGIIGALGAAVDIDLWVVVGGLVVGLIVGMTGMGGGALMTPMLVLLFGVNPSAAISSDLVAAVVMKPIGGAVHFARSTVNMAIVRWLALGSLPSAFCGVLLVHQIGGHEVEDNLKLAMGIALLLAVAGLISRALIHRDGPDVADVDRVVAPRPLWTVLVGVFGGLVVGMTSVGSGSLMIVALMMLYPALSMRQLVGTDLVQAIPLVASAALGQAIFGDVRLGLTTSLLLGAVPGVYVGARLSATVPGSVLRWALGIALLASATKLLHGNDTLLGVVTGLGVAAWVGTLCWQCHAARRRRRGVSPAAASG